MDNIVLKIGIVFFAGFFLASCATTHEIPEIRLKPGEFGMQINKPSSIVSCVAYSPRNKYVAMGKDSGEFILWDLDTGSKVWSALAVAEGEEGGGASGALEGNFVGLLFSPDEKQVVSVGAFGMIRFWDVETGRLLHSFRATKKDEAVWSASMSPDGKSLLVGGGGGASMYDGLLRLFSVQGSVLKEFPLPKLRWPSGYTATVVTTDISPDGKLGLVTYAGRVATVDLEAGRELKAVKLRTASASFLPDGKRAVADDGDTVALVDMETGQVLKRFGENVWYPAVSADGKKVIFLELQIAYLKAQASTPFKIWDIETAREEVVLKGLTESFLTTLDQVGKAKFSPDGKRVASFNKDAAIRVWDSESGAELLTLAAFDDGEWLAVTAEGYYNASANGHKYLNVHFGDSKYTAEAFYDVFYRPDIVAAKLRGEDISGLITITMKDAIKSPPPVVEISPITTSPTSSKAKVCYNVKSAGGGIGEIRLFHNGKLIESDGYYKEAAKTVTEKTELAKLNSKAIYEEMRSVRIKEKGMETGTTTTKPKGEAFNDCKEIDAISGENEISMTAFNKDNTVQSYMQTAKFTSTIKQEEPNLYILSIGIDQYKDNTVNLKYAVKDSKDIEERIMKQADTLYKQENIHYELITDKNATKANITNKITELSKKIKPTDRFILFVAGHGILLQNQYYMLTSEYDGKVNENSLISSNEIVEISKKIKSLSQFFIFDTCHAGGVDYIVSGLYDARMSVLAKKMGLHIYASASDKQSALDGYQGNGLFTYTLLDGLNNKIEADKNQDKQISLTELGEYSKQATTDISKKIGHAQTPLIINFGKDNAVYQLK